MTGPKKHIVIIGAGIVGVSTAIWLQREGHQVTILDKMGPAEGTSYGNGGVLASCAIVPVTVPGLAKKAPAMLFSRNQPLFLKWPYLPILAPWLIKYMQHANAKDCARIAAAQAPIIGDSFADHKALAQGTKAERWLRPSDYLFVYKSLKHYRGDQFTWDLRRKHGFDWEELDGKELSAYDPVFGREFNFATKLKDHGMIADPGLYIKALAAHVQAMGGKCAIAEVTDIIKTDDRVTGVQVGDSSLPCDAVVIATGVWSKPLAKKLGIEIPMESERGYHLELYEPSFMPRSPVMVTSGKFVATPMEGRLRLAGIVEFGGLKAPPSEAPIELLKRNIQTTFPGLTWKDEEIWMGHRPALPDSIPVIGAVPGIKGAYMGFGHHHVGLTGGPKTGRLLAQMVTGKKPNLDMEVYSPSRFQS